MMKSWIAKRVTELLGLEDEVVIGYIYEQMESEEVGRFYGNLEFFVDFVDQQGQSPTLVCVKGP